MTHGLIAALALLSGPPADAAFRYAVESSVRAFGVPPSAVLTPRQALLVKGLDSNLHGNRERADALLRADPAGYRAWCWAAWSPDPEVRGRACSYLAGVPCGHCRGRVVCPAVIGDDSARSADCAPCEDAARMDRRSGRDETARYTRWSRRCLACAGTGLQWRGETPRGLR